MVQLVGEGQKGFLRLMRTKDGFTGPVNLGNPGELTILELGEKVLGMTGSRSKPFVCLCRWINP